MRKVLHFIILGVALGGVRVLHFPKVCQNEMYFYTAFFSMKKVLPDWAEIAPHACQLVSGLGYMAYFFSSKQIVLVDIRHANARWLLYL